MKLHQILLLEDAVEDSMLLTDVSVDDAEAAFKELLTILHAHPEHTEGFTVQLVEEDTFIIVANEGRQNL